MAVFRIERTRDYTVMSNHHLRNGKLSLKAKGLLSMMLSLPEDWNYNKAWAKTIPMPEDSDASRHCADLVVDGVNPGLTDLFTRQARKTMQEQQKSSVLQKLRQESPARKPAAPKKREPER